MKTYWDYSEKERSNLTREQVNELLKYELMDAGVVIPPHPGDAPEPPVIDEPTVRLYGVKMGYGAEMYFRDRESAETCVRLKPVKTTSDYRLSSKYIYIQPEDCSITEHDVYERGPSGQFDRDVKEYASRKSVYEAAKKAYDEALKTSERACESIWDDWHEHCGVRCKASEVAKLWNRYVDDCEGDQSIALRFLQKAFTVEEIVDANEWVGAGIPIALPEVTC